VPARFQQGVDCLGVDPFADLAANRAVLIAWVRGAAVGTDGLRWAYRRHFEFEERTDRNRLEGKRVDEDEPDFDFPPDFYRSLARARMGKAQRPEDLAAFERHTGPRVREVMAQSKTPTLLPAPEEGTSLGIAVQRTDGSWRIPQMGSALWEALSLRPQSLIANTALREELDAAREPTRTIMQASGVEPSDLVVAGQVPESVGWFRKWHGPHWWVAASMRK